MAIFGYYYYERMLMMKWICWIPYCFVTLFLLLACDDIIPKLPLETQSGNNTFGCLINGELVVAEYTHKYFMWNEPVPRAYFNHLGDTLVIEGYGQRNQSFRFFVARPTMDTYLIDSLEYTAPEYRYTACFGKVDGIQLSCLNDHLVSGTFAFRLDTASNPAGSPALNVTMGRFDITFKP